MNRVSRWVMRGLVGELRPALDRRVHVRPRRPAELVAHAPGEGADDEVVRVFDQVAYEPIGKAAVERDRVPVAFVQVIAGADRWIALAKGNRQPRLALDAHLKGPAAQRAQGEHLASDLEHGDLGPEGEVLDRAGLPEAPRPQFGRVHAPHPRTAPAGPILSRAGAASGEAEAAALRW